MFDPSSPFKAFNNRKRSHGLAAAGVLWGLLFVVGFLFLAQDNLGRSAIVSFILDGHSPVSHTPLFGCSLL
jgi:hypothetical protein